MISRLLLAAALLCAVSYGQVTVSPLLQPHQTFVDQGGAPCAGCALFSYTAGTTIATPTYQDAGGSVPNTNPVILSVQGGANIWVDTSLAYKFVLKNTTGTTLWTVDNVKSSNVVTTVLPASGSMSDNLTIGNATAITSVNDPVLGLVPTRLVSKGATSDNLANPAAFLDSTGRPVAQFDGAGRLNLDGYQSGGPVIDLRNWNTLASGGLIGHYAFGMKTDSGQPITSGYVSNIMNTNTQHNVNTTIELKFARNLDASTCSGFCQPNGLISAGAGGLAIYDGLPILCIDQTTLNGVQCQIGKVLQLRPLAPGDTFTFPNNSNSWLHIDAAQNIRFIDDGTQPSIQSVNDAGTAFQPLGIVANVLNITAPVAIAGNLSATGTIAGAVNQAVTIRPAGTTANDLIVQNPGGTKNNFIVQDNGAAVLSKGTFSGFGTCSTGNEGSMAAVTDSTTATYGTAVTGGGTNHIKMYCNGTNWVVD